MMKCSTIFLLLFASLVASQDYPQYYEEPNQDYLVNDNLDESSFVNYIDYSEYQSASSSGPSSPTGSQPVPSNPADFPPLIEEFAAAEVNENSFTTIPPTDNTIEIENPPNPDQNLQNFQDQSFPPSDVSPAGSDQGSSSSVSVNSEDLCHVYDGKSNIVLDILESEGNRYDQGTEPGQLPIFGQPDTEVKLDLVFPAGNEYFYLEGKSLRLSRPLDRDEEDLSSIVFQVTCTVVETGKRRTIPVIVRVSDLNDNTPLFIGTPYSINIPEDTPVGSVVFRNIRTEDPDSGPNGLVQYRIIPGDGSPSDGYGMFSINLPHQGIITVSKPLDFESTTTYYLTLEAMDQAPDGEARSQTTIITVHIMDSDDLGPKFTHSVYTASVPRGILSGALDIRPEKIQAEDGDSLRAEIVYRVLQGTPESYKQFFRVDKRTGVVRQIRALDADISVDRFELVIEGMENTPLRRRVETKLIINIEAVDAFPPELTVSSNRGYVLENSDVGTVVLDSDGNPVQFTVTDRDVRSVVDLPKYILEFTSDIFTQNTENQLIVNIPNLDRDPPSQPKLMVQVVAREDRVNGKSSGPVTLQVNIKDENDNAPLVPSFSPFTIEPGNSRRFITNLNATDLDEDDTIKYRITDVTNGGKRIFYVNPNTGDLEVIGRVNPGEKYTVTVSAKDSAGAIGKTTIDILVSKGANLRPPNFEKLVYDAQVSEGAGRYTTVARIQAKDPEGGLVTYSILSGNNEDHFSIEESSGVIRVNQALDREDIRRYTLTVKAEDEEGKGSTATVNIMVTDINDENPTFLNTPYSFRVKEGEVGALVGKVTAEDKDYKDNANITFSLDEDSDFQIGTSSGEIRTKTALDFEKSQVHYVVITAKDGGKEPRLATATATVLVQDISDEIPYFPQSNYEAVVPENIKEFLVTQVKAEDRDSIPQITYRIMSGDLEKFRIDTMTGEIYTIQGLDYERKTEHVLVIGTEQALLQGASGNSSTCRIKITVQDVNDLPPEFTRVPTGNTVYVRNDAKVNDVVGSVEAVDRDGTAPGNIVRFDLGEEGSSESAKNYFRVEPESGKIILLGDLSNEVYEEYKLEIIAYDQGEDALFTSTEILVKVEQVVTLPPNTGVGFTQLKHVIEVMENTPQEAVLKTLSLTDLPDRNITIRCSVSSAKDKNGRDVGSLFRGELSDTKECKLILARSVLDFEEMTEYTIKMKVSTLTAFINSKRKEASLTIRIMDKNDNSPEFVFNQTYSGLIKDKYLASLTLDTEIGTKVAQVEAFDRDSGNLGMVHYELSTDTQATARSFFSIDAESGVVTTARNLQEVASEELPFRIIINARDNPGFMEDSKMSRAELVVNVVQRDNIFILVLKGATPEQIQPRHKELEDIMSDQSDLIVTIERSVQMLEKDENDTCCIPSQSDTDVWFYAVDPETEELLSLNDSTTEERILGKQAQTNLKYIVTGDFHVQASDIHAVFAETSTTTLPSTTSVKSISYPSQYSGYPSVLIAIGCLVFVSSFAAIVYLLVLYARYKHAKNSAERMIVVPRYEPVFVEPNLKQYETQVLQMNVNVDDVDNDLRIDFRNRNHRFDPGFNLDNVSYITHETNSTSGSPVQDPEPSHSTFRAATVSGRVGRPLSRNPSNNRSSAEMVGREGRENLVYQEDSNLIFHGRQDFNTSTPKRTHSFKTPIDATTQL